MDEGSGDAILGCVALGALDLEGHIHLLSLDYLMLLQEKSVMMHSLF